MHLIRSIFQRTRLLLVVLCLGGAARPGTVFADAPRPITITPVVGFSTLSQAMSTLISAAIVMGALLTFIYLVIGAFKYVSAGDDASNVKSAKTIITNAIVGLILLALVFVIFQIVIRVIPGLSSFFSV
jgi:vacuolar-type H+-ATPase subunit I/STV1